MELSPEPPPHAPHTYPAPASPPAHHPYVLSCIPCSPPLPPHHTHPTPPIPHFSCVAIMKLMTEKASASAPWLMEGGRSTAWGGGKGGIQVGSRIRAAKCQRCAQLHPVPAPAALPRRHAPAPAGPRCPTGRKRGLRGAGGGRSGGACRGALRHRPGHRWHRPHLGLTNAEVLPVVHVRHGKAAGKLGAGGAVQVSAQGPAGKGSCTAGAGLARGRRAGAVAWHPPTPCPPAAAHR